MKTLRPDSPLPLYKQLSLLLWEEIQCSYPAGSRIPSEAELATAYHVSIVTVRKAVALLAERGLLEVIRGKGTFVFPDAPDAEFSGYLDFSSYCRRLGKKPSSRTLDLQVLDAEDPRYRFLLREGERQVVELTRLRLADGVPVIWEVSCFSERHLPVLRQLGDGSLYQLLYRNDIHPSLARKRFSIRLANSVLAEGLDVPLGKSLLYISDKVYDESKSPLHLNEMYVVSDRFDIIFDLAK